jgi:hypothetical protein
MRLDAAENNAHQGLRVEIHMAADGRTDEMVSVDLRVHMAMEGPGEPRTLSILG